MFLLQILFLQIANSWISVFTLWHNIFQQKEQLYFFLLFFKISPQYTSHHLMPKQALFSPRLNPKLAIFDIQFYCSKVNSWPFLSIWRYMTVSDLVRGSFEVFNSSSWLWTIKKTQMEHMIKVNCSHNKRRK